MYSRKSADIGEVKNIQQKALCRSDAESAFFEVPKINFKNKASPRFRQEQEA